MAKKIVDEQIKLSIIIDGNEAQKELHDLDKSTRELRETNKTLLVEKKKLEKQGKKESEAYKTVNATIKENNRAINENRNRTRQLQEQIGLTSLTMQQLRSRASQLRIQLNNTIPGSADYIRIQNDLKQVSARMDELRGKARATGMSLGKVADGFNRYAALAASVIATLTGMVLSIQKVLDYNGKLSDSQSDVMKTTGMTKKEVDELTKSFGMFKTRTARIELLKLAEEGGRLGIEGVKNIQKWINVANQLKIALGDELSDTQIREVGKMVDVYNVGIDTATDFEGAMLSLGSALNEVSATGSNQAGYLLDFLKRTGGVSKQIRLNAADNIGYAATFDEIGMSQEVTATAMNKLWMEMAKDATEFAKVAEMSAKDFIDLFDKDANKAMIAFLKGLEKNSGSATKLMASLSEIQVGGTRGDNAIMGLAGSIEKLTEKQKVANVSMGEATSLTDEYLLKNNNLAATLDKIRKKVIGWYSSEGFIEWLTDAVNWFARFIGATEDTDGKMAKFRNGLVTTAKVFAVLLAALMTNVAWQKLVALWTTRTHSANLLYIVGVKARAVAENAGRIFTSAYALATSLLTGNIRGAITAFRALAIAMGATPWGAVLAIVAAVTTAFVLFTKSSNEATWAQKELAKAQSDVTVEIRKEKDELNRLLKVARDETKSKGAREVAIAAINRISPEYLGNLTLDKVNTLEAAKAINTYIAALDKKLKMQALERTLEATYDKEKEIKSRDKSDYTKWYDYLLNGWYDIDQTAEDRKNEELRQLFEDRVSIMHEMERMLENDPDIVIKSDPADPTTPTGDDKKDKAADREAERQRRAHEKRLEEIKKFHEDRIKLEREFEDDLLSTMDEGYWKEWQIEQANYTRKLEDLERSKIAESEINLAFEKSKNKKLSVEQRASFELLAETWLAKNEELNRKIEQETDLHLIRKRTLLVKHSRSEIEVLNENYKTGKILRETNFNNELAALGNNEKAKEKLRQAFQKQELEAEQKHLEDLIALYQRMLQGETMGGVDFSLLSDKDAEELQKNIDLVNKALSELNAKKASLGQGVENPLSNGEASLGLNETDILGFTQDQWAVFFENINQGTIGIETMGMAVQALGSFWAQYGAMVEAGEKRRLQKYEQTAQKKENRLRLQLNRGVISQDQYHKAVDAIEADFNRKKAEMEYKQAKRKKKMDMVSAITSTALAVLNGLNTQPFFPVGLAMSALAGIMGALQIATIAKQPLPSVSGFEHGLYQDYMVKREQDGKVFKTRYGGKTKSGVVNRNTMYMVGENGPEMVIDNKAFRKMNPQLRDSLIRELRGIKGFENGYYNPDTMRVEIPDTANISQGELIAAVIQLSSVLDNIQNNGLRAVVSNKDVRSMKNLKDGIEEYENFRNRNKIQ